MIFLVFFRPHPGVDRLKLYAEFERRPRELQDAVAIQRTFKVTGRNEIYLIVRAANLIFLDDAIAPFQDKADITITPLVEQE
jgi:hypothetical protein